MQFINLSVEYYDLTQKNLFQSFPNSIELNRTVQNGVNISRDEFLAYMMFTEQMDRDGFRTYNELQSRIQHRLGDIDNFLSFNNGSVQSKITSSEMMQPGFTERIGVSLGLCVVNKIHGLTAADWKKIPESRGRFGHPTFDFQISVASTGAKFIQAENKGSIVADNNRQNTVSYHYSGQNGILGKKNYVRQQQINNNIPLHQNLFYGTIGVLDHRPNSIAKIWLVDPISDNFDISPEKYKLISRLEYYLHEFKKIGVRNKIVNALENRIIEIDKAKNYQTFDNVPLINFHSEQLYMDGKMFVSIDTNEAFGKFFIIENMQGISAYIMAFPKALMRIIIRQDFNAILNYFYNPDFLNESVTILLRFAKNQFKKIKMPDNLKFILNERNKSFEAIFYGKVNHTSDGRIFGSLNEPTFSSNYKSGL